MFGLAFMSPCIVMYSYSITNKMHLFLKLFILVTRCTCFGAVFPSVIRSSKTAYTATGICYSATATCCCRPRQQEVAVAV